MALAAPLAHPSRPTPRPVVPDLYMRVERRAGEMVRRMGEAFLAEVPLYRQLPREQLEGEVSDIARANVVLFFRCLREGRGPTDVELAEPRHSAARRAEERVPLEAVLTAYHVGGRVGWQVLVETATAAETATLLVAAGRVQHYIQAVTGAVATAYLDEQQHISGEERDTRRELASALLAGEPTDSLAARLGVTLAPAHLVLALSIAPVPDESIIGVAAAVAGRRKVRRVQAALDAHAGEPVLGLLEAGGGSVLLPAHGRGVATALGEADSVVALLGSAAGAPVTAGATFCSGVPGLAAAAGQAREVLRLAQRLGRPAGAYRLADVLLEYQLTRPSDALPELAALLDPLTRNPDLLRTLECYLDEDLDRRRTAACLHVHPNTLDYRMRRIVELTALDPGSSHGLQLLGAALAARRLLAAPSG